MGGRFGVLGALLCIGVAVPMHEALNPMRLPFPPATLGWHGAVSSPSWGSTEMIIAVFFVKDKWGNQKLVALLIVGIRVVEIWQVE